MELGMEVDLGPGDFVFDVDPATPRTDGTPTTIQFLAHVCCDQTAGWMKTPLGTEVYLGPGHIVLDGVLPSSRIAHSRVSLEMSGYGHIVLDEDLPLKIAPSNGGSELPSNTSFLGSTCLSIPNSISMASAPFPFKITHSRGDLDPPLTRFPGPIRALNVNGISIGSAVFAQMTPECSYTLR